jgi:hypothetical protein
MTRIALRLATASRDAIVRLVVIAGAVALGVGLLLVSIGGINAVRTQSSRTAWLTTSERNRRPSVDEATSDPLWALATLDQYRSDAIVRVDLAPTGPRSPRPPGIPALPGPGEYYASPALSHLLSSTPKAELADRYPGRQIGTIGRTGLASPDSLVLIVGHTASDLAQVPGAQQIRSFETAAQGAPGDPHPGRMQVILAVVAGALLIPVLLFIGAATRLAAAQREQRFAAMRLVGATPRQVSVIAAVEAVTATTAGVALGFAVFFGLRPLVARIPFTGQPFFPSDLSLHPANVVLVALGVPLGAAVVARIAIQRVQISPLGVSRRVTPRHPGPWRVLPLLVGIAELGYFVGRRPATTGGQIRAYGSGFLLTMVGLVVAGPWLTMVGSRIMARYSRRPATLIAARRLGDNPRAAFRAVSGLIVALFISSAALGIITTILDYRTTSTGGVAGRDILTADLTGVDAKVNGPPSIVGTTLPEGLVGQLSAIPGVKAVAAIHVDPSQPNGPGFGPPPGLISCAELAGIPALGHCQVGATSAVVPLLGPDAGVTSHGQAQAGRGYPPAAIPGDRLAALPVATLDVRTNGSVAAIEAARTVIETTFPYAVSATTLGDISPENAQLVEGWKQLANVAIVASLVIAACSLAVSVASGLIDRKRPFSLLRLAGTPLGVLRRVVGLEAAVPLLLVAAAAASTGLLAAHLFLRSQLGESLQPPGAGYYLAVGFGITLALAIIAATLPLLERITGPETARNE